MKKNDSCVEENFERGQFFVFVDQKPLFRLLSSPSTKKGNVCWLKYKQLQRVTRKNELSFGVEDCALLDIVDTDTEQNWVPIFALNIRLDKDGQKNANDIANEFGAARVDFREALLCLEDSKMANLLCKARNPARILLRWYRTFKYCPRCAAPLKMKISKASASCIQCKSEYYPPVSPAAIVLVMDSTRQNVVLIRHPWHPPGLYTAIAGFNECALQGAQANITITVTVYLIETMEEPNGVIDLTCTEDGEVVEVIDLTRPIDCERSANENRRRTVLADRRAQAPSKGGDGQPSDSRLCKCPVCYETFEDVLDGEYDLMALPCGHVICHPCLCETLEETAIREVSEEVGLDVNALEYVGMSQAWPFPHNSLMCAFFGQVADSNARLDPENSGLKAQWFPKDVVKKAFEKSANVVWTTEKNAELRLPPRGVIAHAMIERWLFF
ncbi:NUDIX and zf-C3HC4 domain containing protein [Trichuris trichiura]|uniref:NUDIX and zf-C3HC4 domain containing protein n=1 Tax=Trichuris trichiura TaxID=36087 RepID=A0A077Z336_TRITR|nr:NUDIX and zf-C3HC4 domain containing protein [Trichuris trichiura]